MPSRTLSPRISTTVMTMSLLMTIDSFFFLDSTTIGVYLSVSEIRGRRAKHRPEAPLLRKRFHTLPRGQPTDDFLRNSTSADHPSSRPLDKRRVRSDER